MSFTSVVAPIITLINALMAPILSVVGALGTLYCIFLGIKFAKAEEPQEREKAKGALKNAIIGFLLIFVLMVVLNLAMGVLTDWASAYNTALTTA